MMDGDGPDMVLITLLECRRVVHVVVVAGECVPEATMSGARCRRGGCRRRPRAQLAAAAARARSVARSQLLVVVVVGRRGCWRW